MTASPMPDTVAGAVASARMLLARVGREQFAFPIATIVEAIEAPVVTPLALMPSGMTGQCTHRDQLVPVLDGGVLLGARREERFGVLLLIDTAAGRVGLAVDDVVDMVEIDASRRRALPATGGAMSAMLEDVIDLGTGIAGAVAMDALRAAMAARLTTEAA